MLRQQFSKNIESWNFDWVSSEIRKRLRNWYVKWNDIIVPVTIFIMLLHILMSVVGFLGCYQLIPRCTEMFLQKNISGQDLGKKEKKKIPEAGGVISGCVFLMITILMIVIDYGPHIMADRHCVQFDGIFMIIKTVFTYLQKKDALKSALLMLKWNFFWKYNLPFTDFYYSKNW